MTTGTDWDALERPVSLAAADDETGAARSAVPSRERPSKTRRRRARHARMRPNDRWPTCSPKRACFAPARPFPGSGWRRAVYALTGGLVNPGPSPAEVAAQRLSARVRTPIAGSRRIAVISRKGGVGKTTTTLMLGHTFASERGDRVLAVDANPDAGSLGYRIRRETAATITSLLADCDAIARYADVRAYTSQAPTRLEVLASDDDPRIIEALTDRDYRAAIEVLDRHYNLLLLDSGAGILDSAVQGILREADQLVVVLPAALDGARVAASTLDWLDAHGYAHLVSSSVAVVNAVRPRTSLVEVDRVEAHFAERCAATAHPLRRAPLRRRLHQPRRPAPSDPPRLSARRRSRRRRLRRPRVQLTPSKGEVSCTSSLFSRKYP